MKGRFGQNSGSLFKYVTTNTTTPIKTGPGILKGVIVNRAGATGNTLTITLDGSVFAIIDATAGRNFEYNVPFSTSCSVTTATGTPGDVTVLYN